MNDIIQNNEFLQIIVLGNSVYEWIRAVAVFFAAFLVLKLIRVFVIARLKKIFKRTKTKIDDIIIDSIDSIYWPFYAFAALYAALQFVAVPDFIKQVVHGLFLAVVAYYAIKFLSKLIDFSTKAVMEKKEAEEQDASIVRLISIVAKVMLWVGAVVLILSNLGYNVTSLVAGLGIGGIAVGLAVQNILGDLFSSLAIYFDKPFKIGDFIVVDNYMGTVTKVGIKTSRIQALQGEEIVMANSDLTASRVQNFGKMAKRRVVFNVGVTYDTPADKLRQIPGVIEKVIKSVEHTEFDRAHFNAFGDSSLGYEAVYYATTGDYNIYMDTQQAINLGIVEEFEKLGVEMAFPTRTVYLKKE